MANSIIRTATKFAIAMVGKHVKKGDIVVDATAGNGNDTLALSNLVGEEGKVYAFDVQEEAIERTWNLLVESSSFCSIGKEALQIEGNTVLICDSHEKMSSYISETGKVAAVVFNLGYLPSGDKSINTTAQSSVKAIDESLKILKKGGIVSIVMYPGTEIGEIERNEVLVYSQDLPPSEYHVCYCSFPNQSHMSPEILWIEVK
jgi:tRNA A58 N-methylase Trm61